MKPLLVTTLFIAIFQIRQASAQSAVEKYYVGLENTYRYLGKEHPKYTCYHLTHLAIKGDSIFVYQNPVAIYKKDTLWGVSDGAFYYWKGTATADDSNVIIDLKMTDCDYCAVPLDATLQEKRTHKHLIGKWFHGGIILNSHYFRPSEYEDTRSPRDLFRQLNDVACVKIGNHTAIYDSNGMLLPWISWRDAIRKEMNWYLNCPVTHGYPNFVWMTFMDGNYQPDPGGRRDFIPATQNSLGIISYLQYYSYDQRRNPKVLQWAKYMGDYLINESNTPDTGRYPKFTRSTGIAAKFPQPPDCGTQADKPYEIEPDKGALAGYSLVLLYKETGEGKYLAQALHNARILVANMGEGDSTRSPWPFRADFRTGEPRGLVSGDMVYILRLLDILSAMGHPEFDGPKQKLWMWILHEQLPDLAKGGGLWEQFFEDHDEANDRTAWAPLNLARYLLEKKDRLDSAWRQHTHDLIEFVNRNFTGINHGVPICGEQDHDKDPWGGILSSYGAVLTLYTAATGSEEFKSLATQALNFGTYALNDDGCPCERAGFSPCRGGWQEDAHTDKIHNFIDALEAMKAVK